MLAQLTATVDRTVHVNTCKRHTSYHLLGEQMYDSFSNLLGRIEKSAFKSHTHAHTHTHTPKDTRGEGDDTDKEDT